MNNEERVRIRLLSGCNVDMTESVYEQHYMNFSEIQYFSFNNFINAGMYFPQIMQFITVMIAILNGIGNWLDIMLVYVGSGAIYTMLWFLGKFYKIPGLPFISCFIGGNFFRYFLHYILIAVVSFFVVKEWTILLFCAISGVVSSLVIAIFFAKLSSVKYHDEIVKYVSAFKYK